jgi:hypothetical protein
MGVLSDIAHLFGGDVGVTPSGDLAVVSGSARTTQRVIRRLLSTPTVIGNSAYPWEPPYGAGLAALIGGNPTAQQIQANVSAQMRQEASVAPLPAPVTTVTPIAGGGDTIDIVYTDLSGTPQNFSFNLTP